VVQGRIWGSTRFKERTYTLLNEPLLVPSSYVYSSAPLVICYVREKDHGKATYIKPNIQLVLNIRRCHLPLEHRYKIGIIEDWPSFHYHLLSWFIGFVVYDLNSVVEDKV